MCVGLSVSFEDLKELPDLHMQLLFVDHIYDSQFFAFSALRSVALI
jgi:hypothetical protein